MSAEGVPGHREIAAVCGYSTATVSRALSGHPRVKEATRLAVLRTAQKLGYRNDPRLAYLSQRRWKSGRSSGSVKICALVDSFTYSEEARGKFRELEDSAALYGYELEYLRVESVSGEGQLQN